MLRDPSPPLPGSLCAKSSGAIRGARNSRIFGNYSLLERRAVRLDDAAVGKSCKKRM